MRHYSLYLLKPGHRVGPPIDFDCDTDAEAVEKALRLRESDKSLELWQGTRLIRRIEAAKVVRTHPQESLRPDPY
jgi:hypothetical protein